MNCGRQVNPPISLSDRPLISSEQGTRDFMSIEVAAREFLFIPRLSDEDVSSGDEDEEMARTEVPFFPNHLHDLESLWWVAVWVVFFNYFSVGETPPVTSEDTTEQLRLTRRLFPPLLNIGTRRDVFQLDGLFLGAYAELPRNKKATRRTLNFLRQLLIDQYTHIEKGYPESVNPRTSSYDIYASFEKYLLQIAEKYAGFNLYSIPNLHEKLLKEENAKRPRSDSTNDTEPTRKNPRI
jgi:hypothetical protein